MRDIVARVELHDANEFAYQTLHFAMETAGFFRTIRADDGTLYHLPPATYLASSDMPIEWLRDRVGMAVLSSGCAANYIVFEKGVAAWNLVPVGLRRYG
jgi:hypothetical protein